MVTGTGSPSNINFRDVEPFETSICERLIREVRLCDISAGPALQSPSTAASTTSSLSHVLQGASTAVQFHAKWFLPPALATLLQTTFDVASRSSATTDLSAALNFIDTVGTYSLIPTLLPVVRFISYAYYQGSRSNRHKRISQHAWAVAQHIIESHLGGQFPGALLSIIADRQQTHTRFGIGATIGSLMIIAQKLLPDENYEHKMEAIDLLISISIAAIDHDQILRDQVALMLSGMLKDDRIVASMQRDGVMGMYLAQVQRCTACGLSKSTLEPLLQAFAIQSSYFEQHYLPLIALLFIDARQPLPAELSVQLLHPWKQSLMLDDHAMWEAGYRDLLSKLCDSTLYTPQLEAFVDVSVLAFFQTESFALREQYVGTLGRLLANTEAAPSVVDILAKGIVGIFTHKTHKEKWEAQRNWVFPILCEIASRSVVAADLLLSIRADAAGEGYLELERTSDIHGISTISLGVWVSAIDDMLVRAPDRWDVYNSLLTRLAPQIRNHALWRSKHKEIGFLRESICELLNADSYVEPPAETGLTKSHIVSQLVQILTAIISYHRVLMRQDIKSAIVTIIKVAGSRDHTVSIHCIHALTICCYELPELMADYMDAIINKMTRMVTQRQLAIYVLEFFAGLSRLPELQDGLRREDFKRIFGVCHSYLQSIRSTTALERKRTPTSEQSAGNGSTSHDDMAPYVYALTHHVISFWYMALQSHNRHGLKDYITSCLRYTDLDGKQHIENQGLVTIDLMDRIDAEEQITAPFVQVFDEDDGRIITRHRVTGILLITTETSLRTGKTIVTIRRPSGTAQHLITATQCQFYDEHQPRDENGLEARFTASVTVENDTQDYIAVLPDDVTGRTYGRVAVPRPSSALGSMDIVTLPENDDAVTRAIQAFDRTSALDSHKAGLIFVGERQKSEEEILLNVSGTPDYREFLEDIGTLRKLKGATFNSQGLDRAEDADGEFTIVWNNAATELVYHITTFMPNHSDPSLTIPNKKRHIGNDFVNIVFNNSGSDFDFNTFPSAFNYVYITISPSERTSFVQAREITANQEKKDRFYNVHVLTRPGFPSLSSAGEVKVVSGECLGGYVRNLALNACMFSAMWHMGDASGEYPSSWRQRLEMLKKLHAKYSSYE